MHSILPHMKRREGGSIAVEFAVVMIFVLLPLLAATLFFGRFLWHYTVAEKAAHDAARFIAAASPTELKVQSPTGEAYIVVAAKGLAQAELGELSPGYYSPVTYVFCDSAPCVPFQPLPKIVSVYVSMRVEDPFLTPFTSLFTGDTGPIALQIDATGRSYYLGK